MATKSRKTVGVGKGWGVTPTWSIEASPPWIIIFRGKRAHFDVELRGSPAPGHSVYLSILGALPLLGQNSDVTWVPPTGTAPNPLDPEGDELPAFRRRFAAFEIQTTKSIPLGRYEIYVLANIREPLPVQLESVSGPLEIYVVDVFPRPTQFFDPGRFA